MTNRKQRRAEATRAGKAGKYTPPRNLEYNEYVGELGPAVDGIHTEMHVRYGVLDNKYLDWSITKSARSGGLAEFSESRAPLKRHVFERVEVSNSAIRRHIYNPDDPKHPAKSWILVELDSTSADTVDKGFMDAMHNIAYTWAQKHQFAIHGEDPHAAATFAFAQKDRDPEFRNGAYPWVRNTLLALDNDSAQLILADRGGHYFPGGFTFGVLQPTGMMQFGSSKRREGGGSSTDEDETTKIIGDQTMGMIAAAVNTGEDWIERLLDS